LIGRAKLVLVLDQMGLSYWSAAAGESDDAHEYHRLATQELHAGVGGSELIRFKASVCPRTSAAPSANAEEVNDMATASATLALDFIEMLMLEFKLRLEQVVMTSV
jgi:hypothetical protein